MCVFLTIMATRFVVHGMLLAEEYKALGTMMRSEENAMAHLQFFLLGRVAMPLGITWIYAQGVEDKPWAGQGVRFGLAFWLVGSVGGYLIYYAVQPLPAALVTKQIGFGLVECVIMGLVAAAVYRK